MYVSKDLGQWNLFYNLGIYSLKGKKLNYILAMYLAYHNEDILILYNQRHMLPTILLDHSKVCMGNCVIAV